MKWRFQFIALSFIMSCLILAGIHLAEQGTRRVDGFRSGPLQSFHISKTKTGVLEMTVLGRAYQVQGRSNIQSSEETGKGSAQTSSSMGRLSQAGSQISKWLLSMTKEVLERIKN